ncbi:putative disease resistance protein RGA3 [Gossypium arboreum]|uniref:putative disease resistance protein RGA3 n=1 Tax=Gossypium arboreum TaxID=29729 RepID=UPI0022F18741|nr:putative disease resistance protein RGA3 [Gossypium arboreum]
MLRFVNSEAFDISGWKELESLSQNGLSLVGHRFITIVDCPQLVSLETEEERLQLDKIPGVESLEIRDCERLNRLPEILHAFPFITRIKLEKCPGLVCFAKRNFPPALKELEICECENLQYLVDENVNNKSMSSNTCLLEHLEIRDCPSLIWLSSRGDICNRLQHLKIESGSKLRSLFLNSKLPVMLKHLVILDCPLLESIAQNFHETVDLESIRISNAENIKSLPRGLDKLSHLQEIEVDGCLSDHCENFRALPKCINNFTSLRELKVRECSADLSFPEEGSPTNLASLEILNAPKIYTSLVEWGLNRFTSLQELQISGEGCSSLMSFPEEGIGMTLPPSLRSICIENFENLEYMCSKGFQHLTSLQQLRIYACPKRTSLPEKDMLLSLDSLSIWGCPLLEEGFSRGKGREWSKIAHIPFVFIQAEDAKKENVPSASDSLAMNVDVLDETSNGTQSSRSNNKLVDVEDELQV